MVKFPKNNKSQCTQAPYHCNKQKGRRRVYDAFENSNHKKQVALGKLSDMCLNYKPRAKG